MTFQAGKRPRWRWRLLMGTVASLTLGLGGPVRSQPSLNTSMVFLPVLAPLDPIEVLSYPEMTFEAGSLIIPMDECHQFGGQTADAATRAKPQCYCPDAIADDGVIKAYGLIYRLLEHGITINVVIDDAKTTVDGKDFTIAKASEPVKKYDRATGNTSSFYTSGAGGCAPNTDPVTIDYRGAPFVIPVADAPAAMLLIKNGDAVGFDHDGDPATPVRGVFTATTFATVDVHVAQTKFTAKVARSYNGPPRPLALLNLGNAALDVLTGYLTRAGINTAGAGGTACAPGTIYGTFSLDADFTGGFSDDGNADNDTDCLKAGNYAALWAPHWVGTAGGKALKIRNYKKNTTKVQCDGEGPASKRIVLKNANTCEVIAEFFIGADGKWTKPSPAAPPSGVWANPPPCRIAIDSEGEIVESGFTGAVFSPCANPGGGGVCPSTTAPLAADSPADLVVSRIADFVDNGNALFAECASIETFEGAFKDIKDVTDACGSACPALSVQATKKGHFQMSNGVVTNYLSGTYADGSVANEGYLYRQVASPFVQKGDLRFQGTGGHIHNWKPAGCETCSIGAKVTHGGIAGSSQYLDGAISLLTTCAGDDWSAADNTCVRSEYEEPGDFKDHKSNWDILSYRRKDNDPRKGPIVYLAGHDYGKDTGMYGGIRLVLNTMLNLEAEVAPQVPAVPRQIVRSSPVVAALNNLLTYIQGTLTAYEPAEDRKTFAGIGDAAGFEFPYYRGHVYAYDAANIGTDPTIYQDLGTPLWDAAGGIPEVNPVGCGQPFGSTCRTVFTNVASGVRPDRIMFNLYNRNAFWSLLAPAMPTAAVDALIPLILAGRTPAGGGPKVPTLGGIDRSSMALIEPSPTVGNARPTMLYGGGADGMLHAFCADTVAPCDVVGRELWAYLPRTQLGKLRFNLQRLDGSPRVGDAYEDFDGNGVREWRTVLTMQTGSGTSSSFDVAPTLFALDVTDPSDPKILWERSTPAVRGAFEQGTGMGLAMGSVHASGGLTYAVFASTNNGGTGAAGMHVQAYSLADGHDLWPTAFKYTYPPPRSGGPAVPGSGIPAGVAAVDLSDQGSVTHLVVPSLYGDIFLLDATDGHNVYGSDPLFRFSQDRQPIGATPAIYHNSSGGYFAIAVSGGYVDPDGATWTDLTGTHHIVAVRLTVPADETPLDESGPNTPDRPFSIPFTGESGFAQPTIAGNRLFVASSDRDVNQIGAGGSGHLYVVNLETGQLEGSPVRLGSGTAASAEVTIAGAAYIAGTEDVVRVDTGGPGAGLAAEVNQTAKTYRSLWLRTD